jgi:hypothetical protein
MAPWGYARRTHVLAGPVRAARAGHPTRPGPATGAGQAAGTGATGAGRAADSGARATTVPRTEAATGAGTWAATGSTARSAGATAESAGPAAARPFTRTAVPAPTARGLTLCSWPLCSVAAVWHREVMSEVAAPEPPAVGRAAVPPPPPPRVPPAPPPPAPPPRPPGTVYRAAPAREPALDPPSDGSGSLTGFILSRGRADAAAPKWRLAVIAVAILLMIAVLAVIGLVVVSSLFDSLLGD